MLADGWQLRSAALSTWTGQFLDAEYEKAFLRSDDRAQYHALRLGLLIAAITYLLAAISDYYRLGGFTAAWSHALIARCAVAAAALAVIAIGRRNIAGSAFLYSLWAFTGILIAANFAILQWAGLDWQTYSVTVIVELFLYSLVISHRPFHAMLMALTVSLVFIIHGVFQQDGPGYLRSAMLILAVNGLCYEFIRKQALSQRSAFRELKRAEQARAEMERVLSDIQSDRDVMEQAAARNIQLMEEIDHLRRDAEGQTDFLHAILNTITQGVAVYDADMRLTAWNTQFEDLSELPQGLAKKGIPIEDIARFVAEQGAQDKAKRQSLYQGYLKRVENGSGADPYVIKLPKGERRVLEIHSNWLPGGGLVSTYTDITEHKKAEEAANHMAIHDALTGLKNRRGFMNMLQAATDIGDRRSQPFALAMFDLDGFKAVNDTHGHPVGDALLERVAEIITQEVRAGDCVARMGGDEFAVIFTSVKKPEDAEIPARRIIDKLRRPIVVDGKELQVGTSIGLGFYPTDAVGMEELLSRVDEALYRAKHDGKGRLVRVAA